MWYDICCICFDLWFKIKLLSVAAVSSDVVGEKKSGSGFGVGLGLGMKMSGIFSSGFRFLRVKVRVGLGWVQVLLFGFGDQNVGNSPLGFRVFGSLTTSLNSCFNNE